VNGRSALDRFLQTDPRDVGCDEAMQMLHIYVELVAADAGAAQRYPGIAAHLYACGPCSDDFHGLLAAVTGPGPDTPDRQTADYRIRPARPDEIQRLREIEDEAGTMFAGLGLIDETLDVSFPLDDLARLIGIGQVWVTCPDDGAPVGMVIASVREGAVYIEEMDVLPAHGRRGLGARLLGTVCAWAEAQEYPTVTLSTFRDVPWNGPFYRKHGLTELHPAQWTPGMRAIRKKEAQHGLRVEARVFMRRELTGVRPQR